MIPSADTWQVEFWKFKNQDEVRALTDDQLLSEWHQLATDMRVFFKYRVILPMQISWLFSALVAIAHERGLSLADKEPTDQMPT